MESTAQAYLLHLLHVIQHVTEPIILVLSEYIEFVVSIIDPRFDGNLQLKLVRQRYSA